MLDPVMTNQLQCVLTHRAGISAGLHTLVDRQVVNGQSFNDVAACVRECHHTRALGLALQCAGLRSMQQQQQRGTMDQYITRSGQQVIPRPSDLMPTHTTPTGNYFMSSYKDSLDSTQRRAMFDKLLVTTPVRFSILKFDHCHKPAKNMRHKVRPTGCACNKPVWHR